MGHVVVDDTGDILEHNFALCHISGHQDWVLALFEASKVCLTLVLQQRHTNLISKN